MKKIVHIDLNAFFAQAEVLLNPKLANKAIAIGSDHNRGVISTSSYEARKAGVYSGMSTSEALIKCPDLIIIDVHYSYYKLLSERFFSYLRERYPIIQQASIDECYIDMTDQIKEPYYDYLFDLQLNLYKTCQLKCSIGLGETKFLAKMASDYKKPLGITIIMKKDIPEILWPIKIEKMYGIGKKSAPRLVELGIKTIGDLAKTDDERVKRLLGKSFTYHQAHANGYGDNIVDSDYRDPKSISVERTLSFDVSNEDELIEDFKYCVVELVKELKKKRKKATSISIKLRDNNFSTRSKRQTIKSTSDESEIFLVVSKLFEEFYDHKPLRLIGVGAEKIEDE